MGNISDLEANISQMQQLLNAAQNDIQKKTFEEIINRLSQELEKEKSKLNSSKVKTIEVDKPLEGKVKKKIIQLGKHESKKNQNLKLKCDSKIEEKSQLETEEIIYNNEEESLPPKQDYLFHGLGVLYGRIVKRYEDNDNYYNAIIDDKTYQLIIINPRVRHFMKVDYNPEKNRYLTVYPNIVHYPQPRGGRKEPKVSFTIIAANDFPTLDLEPNEFRLFGLWQFIAVSRCPVISIHRNRKNDGSDRVSVIKERFKNNDKLHKNLTRANHVPLLWRDSPVKPFKFNPRFDKDKQGDRYFCKIKAKFLAYRGVWGFQELLVEPTLDIPKFYKPIKIAFS